MAAALVLIDIQNDYFSGGKMELDKSTEASECARFLLNYFREMQRPIVHIQHIAIRPGATFFLPDTEGVKTHANVMPLEGEVVIQQHFPNSFRETRLLEHLRQNGIDQLIIAGMMTHMCVDATVRAATDYGFPCLIAGDACATKTLTLGDVQVPASQVHAAFLSALDGSYGHVLMVEEIIHRLKS